MLNYGLLNVHFMDGLYPNLTEHVFAICILVGYHYIPELSVLLYWEAGFDSYLSWPSNPRW